MWTNFGLNGWRCIAWTFTTTSLVIMCAMKKNISPKAEEIVKEEDPLAFMIVTSATEIFGEGYKSYFSEKL